jgi:hypothetical protein
VTRFALKALLGRKLRTVLSAFAIVLGVATVSGTYVLTDSSTRPSGRSSRRAVTDPTPSSAARLLRHRRWNRGSGPAFDESLLEKVRALPDVRVADGSVNGEAQLIGNDGKAIVYGGARISGSASPGAIRPSTHWRSSTAHGRSKTRS